MTEALLRMKATLTQEVACRATRTEARGARRPAMAREAV